jgi:hypothetical protein
MTLQGFYQKTVERIVWKGKVHMEGESSCGNQLALCIHLQGNLLVDSSTVVCAWIEVQGFSCWPRMGTRTQVCAVWFVLGGTTLKTQEGLAMCARSQEEPHVPHTSSRLACIIALDLLLLISH